MRAWQKYNLTNILVMLPAAALLYYLVRSAWLFVSLSISSIRFPFVLDYGEGPILDQVARLATFQNIYHPDPTFPPFTICNYTPLYPLLQVPFYWAFGPDYLYGRAISSLSIVATAVFIALTLHTITKDRLASISAGMLLLSIPYIVSWSPLCRVDSLALMFSWAGIFVTVRWPQSRKALVVSALALVAAIYTKQSYALAAPFGAVVWLIKNGEKAKAFKRTAIVVSLSLGLFLVLNLLTHGGFFFNIVTANINRFMWDLLEHNLANVWETLPYLVVLSAVFMLTAYRIDVRGYWLAAPYLLASAVTALTIAKIGSNVNYLFELSAGLSLMAGTVLAASGRRWWARGVLIALLAVQSAHLVGSVKEVSAKQAEMRNYLYRNSPYVLSEIKSTNGPVLADGLMGLLPLAGRQIYLQPFEFTQLSDAGVWDETPLVDAIKNKKFGLIAIVVSPEDLCKQRWTEAQLQAVETNYHPVKTFAGTTIFKPD